MSYQTDTSEDSNVTEYSDSENNSISSETSADSTDYTDGENSESHEVPESSDDTQADDTSSEDLPPHKPKKLFEKPQTTQPVPKVTKNYRIKPVANILESYPGETTISRAYLDQASQLVAENYSMVPFGNNLIRSAVNYKLYHSRYYMNLNTNAKNISQELNL